MKIRTILSHLIIILSLCFLTFAVLDWYNPMMNFSGNTISSKLLLVLCVRHRAGSSDAPAPETGACAASYGSAPHRASQTLIASKESRHPVCSGCRIFLSC